MRALMTALLLAIGGSSAACDEDPATAEQTCQHLCDCAVAFPAQERRCVAECVEVAAGVPSACLDCLATTTCTELGDDGVCELECAAFFSPVEE